MRRLIRPTLFALARLGLFLAVANAVACQDGNWVASGPLPTGDSLTIASHFSGYFVSLLHDDSVSLSIRMNEDAVEYFAAQSHFQQIFPGIATDFGLPIMPSVRVHHAWIIFAATLFYAAVKLLYWKRRIADE